MFYRFYGFDQRGMRTAPEIIEARSDMQAIEKVKINLHKRCELWDTTELVWGRPTQRFANACA